MTESKNPAPADAASCPDCSKLLAFAELDEMIVAGVASPGQMTQHDELARELSGDKQSGEAVAAVLARQLAESRHSVNPAINLLQVKADELIEKLRRDLSRESLRKDPTLAILPSGDAISLGGLLEAWTVREEDLEDLADEGYPAAVGNLVLNYRDSDRLFVISDVEDIAAVRAALHNIGVAINAPTIAGEDRDGDGRTGE